MGRSASPGCAATSLTRRPCRRRWETALDRAKARCNEGGRVLVADFDTYRENGKLIQDFLLRNWYKQDGVRITATHRDEISERFPGAYFHRFQKRLGGVPIPHYFASCAC